MKILIVTHYFPPEIGAPQARLSEFAKFWAEAGEEVTVLTGMPNHPTGVIPPEYKGAIRRDEQVDGYRVVRTWLYATPNEGFVKKTLGHLSFMASSVVLGFRSVGRPDVVIVSSPTFFSIFAALLISGLRRAPLVLEVRDLWPAIFVELGLLKNRTIIRLLEKVELWCYKRAAAIVVVTEGFREHLINRNISSETITVIRNGVDLELFKPRPLDTTSVRTRLGVPVDAFLTLYIGAHGISHALTSAVDAAMLVPDQGIHFAFVGEGAEKRHLEDYIAGLKVTNVTSHPAVPRHEVPDILQAADVCLVSLRNIPLFDHFIPSKMFEYFAAGRPVIGAVQGESGDIINAAGGITVPPENPVRLAEALHGLRNDGPRQLRMSTTSRKFAEAECDRRTLSMSYRSLLRKIGSNQNDHREPS